jgi:hypothetical protein
MEYLIFTDESGKWNEGDYYIRVWIKISLKDYEILRKEIIFAKYETRVKELKWEKFSKNSEKFKNIFSINFEIFVTISIPKHFQDRLDCDSYNIIKTLKRIKDIQLTGGEMLKRIIKDKIINSANHTLFFNIFEKQHIKNSIETLVEENNYNSYKYIIDTPQCLDKEWLDIIRECGVSNVEIKKKSEECPGIELADVIAGCIYGYIFGNYKAECTYKNYIKNKMVNMKSQKHPNPNLIFYQDFTEEQKGRLNKFR